jgi:hypothetical protein
LKRKAAPLRAETGTTAVCALFVVYFNASTAENQPKRGDFPPLSSVFLDGAPVRRRDAALKRSEGSVEAEFAGFNVC